MDGAELASFGYSCSEEGPLVTWVRPFSWDAEHEGFAEHSRRLGPGMAVRLVAGPYGVADAAAWNAGASPVFDGRPDRPRPERYLTVGATPREGELYQDACGWVALQLGDDGPTAVLAWEYSGTVVATVERDPGRGVRVTVELPADVYAPTLGRGESVTLPAVVEATLPETTDGALAELRDLVVERYIRPLPPARVRDGAEWPYLVVDTWGLEEDISEADVLRRMAVAADLGAEVFTVDKGWERSVGDWRPGDGFPGGLERLGDEASRLGLGLGLWCAFGNADPRAPVVREHPDWLATWRGASPIFSFGNHALCLGHEPARAWALAELDRLVREGGLTWLLHDFETIARCDSERHTHDPGAGEAACVAALGEILETLRARHPHLVVENCWNGGKPIDLQMVGRHDTTIGDDWARALPNRIAKAGLGRFLPPDWCSCYMGDEELPPRYQVASYVLGGPWILMGDMDAWDEARWDAIRRGVDIYRRWRGVVRRASVEALLPPTHAGEAPDALQAVDGATGRSLLVVARHADGPAMSVRVEPRGIDPADAYLVVDEWTGAERRLPGAAVAAGVDVELDAGPDAAVVGLVPVD